MRSLTLTRVHCWIALVDLMRSPSYVVPTVVFPAMFFALFDLPVARTQASIADYTMLAFIAWAVIGVALYQFGVGIAQERGRPWERYQRTLPVSVSVRFAARIVCALVFGAFAAVCVAAVALAFAPVSLTVAQWMLVCLYTFLGGVPFVLFGIAVGYWSPARAAVPLATAFNLLLAYAGGLWMPPQYLPAFVAKISPFLPTRQFADVLWSVVGGSFPTGAATGLILYAVAFAGVAALGYRRDERTRYA
ncbi:MAG: ABC transporter permease [Candidatus Eremiobacteraeota bacterium]|nr:ABC transporter permease [Candidatus Eremiobacteraeota bacterium]